jgi:PAS domain S-box-containing protein
MPAPNRAPEPARGHPHTAGDADSQVEALTREVERLRVLASRDRGLLQAILEHSPHGIIISDKNGKLTLQNKAAEKIWAGSATADDIEGWGQYRAFHADGRPFEPGDWSMARALRDGTITVAEEQRFQRFDGSFGTLIGSSAPFYDADGNIDGALAVFVDISSIKEHEDRRRFISEASAILAGSLDYGVTLASVAKLAVPTIADWCAIDMVGDGGRLERLAVEHIDPEKVRFAAEIEARYPADPSAPYGVHQVIRSGVSELYSDIPDELLTSSAVDDEHLRLIRALGLRSAMTVPLRCRETTLGAISFVSAESSRRFSATDLALAEALANVAALAVDNARLYRSAQEANRSKDEFLAVVSHELRTPLNAVLGWAHLLKTGSLPADKRLRALDTIERNARAQAQLIDDLLDVSRIVAGKLRLDVAPLDLTVPVQGAIDAMRPAADSKGVTLESFVEPRASWLTSADGARLQQVVVNLLSNAIHFTDRGGRVTVSLRPSGDAALIEVADTGQGIAPELLPLVFDRFRQGIASRGRSQPGLGLGLAIVKHLIELHGGAVSAESAGAGKGASFCVRLPLLAPAATAQAAEPADTQRLAGLRVLVVDDDDDARALVAELLKTTGAVVETATSAAEALDRVIATRPDVLVSDIGMPGEDGYSLIRRIRALPGCSASELPATALTAFARREDCDRALGAGFQAHLTKPLDPEALFGVIASLRHGAAKRQQ